MARIMDEELDKLNEENLQLSKKSFIFHRVENVEIKKYTGKVYDLKIKNTHNYTTSIGMAHNGGKRPGSACLYLETWHPDIMDFLELRDNTGDKERRAHNLNLANWIPDLFMKRVKEDLDWSFIDPSVAPELPDLFGDAFEKRYTELEEQGKIVRKESARKIYARMMRTLAETGNGWMCWKDTANKACNSATNGRVVHSSNLCLSPETLIRAIVDGDELDISIKILTEKFKHGSEISVYSLNEETLKYEWQPILSAGVTANDAEVIEVWVDDKLIECTENHLFLTTDRGWVKAIDLKDTDILFKPEMKPTHKLELFIKIRKKN